MSIMKEFDKKANKKVSFPFILGSGSPRRSELLRKIISDFTVVISDAEELEFHSQGVIELVKENACLKATSVANDYPDSWVLGADTLVALGDRVLGKPKTMDDAFRMLRMLSGKTHEVSTGLCLVNRSKNFQKVKVDTSKVTFKKLDDLAISNYFLDVNPLDKAGGYAIQTRPDLIIEDFHGSHSNVIGLPLELLAEWLRELEII